MLEGMAEEYEYKTVKVPMNSPHARTRILNRLGKDGWEVVDMRKGGLFATKDQVTLLRPKK